MNTGKLSELNLADLLQQVQSAHDTACRDAALDLVRGVMEVHAEGLKRMMDLAHEPGRTESVFEVWAADELVSSMLLLHDLHPWDLERRVRNALAQPSLHSRGASAELISLRDGVVRVHIAGGPAFRSAVESALGEAAPDAAGFVIEGGDAAGADAGFVPLAQLTAR